MKKVGLPSMAIPILKICVAMAPSIRTMAKQAPMTASAAPRAVARGAHSSTMMFKLAQAAQKRWRRLNGHQHIVHLLEGKQFVNGVMQDAA